MRRLMTTYRSRLFTRASNPYLTINGGHRAANLKIGFITMVTTQTIRVTPLMASTWLLNNSQNRTISQHTVTLYSRAMQNNEWRETHQGIAFYEDGTLADGQHRLHAVMQSGCTVPMLVTNGLARDTAYGIDANRPRSTSDIVRIGGEANWLDTRIMQALRVVYPLSKISASEAIALATPIKDNLLFANKLFPNNMKGINATLRAAIALAHYYGADERRLEEFANVIYTGVVANHQDTAAIKIRDILMFGDKSSSRANKDDLLSKVQHGIYKFLRYEPIKVVRPSSDLPYPRLSPKFALKKQG